MNEEIKNLHIEYINDRIDSCLKDFPHEIRIGKYPEDYNDFIRYDVPIEFYAIPPLHLNVFMDSNKVEEIDQLMVARQTINESLTDYTETYKGYKLANRIMELVYKRGFSTYCLPLHDSDKTTVQSSFHGCRMFDFVIRKQDITLEKYYNKPIKTIAIDEGSDIEDVAHTLCNTVTMYAMDDTRSFSPLMSQFVKVFDIYGKLEDMGATDMAIDSWNGNIYMRMKLEDIDVQLYGNDFTYNLSFSKRLYGEVSMKISTYKRNLIYSYIERLWKKIRKRVDTDWTGCATWL